MTTSGLVVPGRALVLALGLTLGLVTGCATPGAEVRPLPGDFAFLQVDLRG